MRRLTIISLLALAGWQGYAKFQGHRLAQGGEAVPQEVAPAERRMDIPPQSFRCDGRTHCSQMTSCEEAMYFLRNCPETNMDGDHDGIPCEQQWCR
jgi:hypothetical protein